jgi:hypothetical protein
MMPEFRADYAPTGRWLGGWRALQDGPVASEAKGMKRKSKTYTKAPSRKSVLRLPDLEVARSAVLNSLSCPDAQRGYRHAIDEFVEWYCSEPRL